jgi:hypothetical protein
MKIELSLSVLVYPQPHRSVNILSLIRYLSPNLFLLNHCSREVPRGNLATTFELYQASLYVLAPPWSFIR